MIDKFIAAFKDGQASASRYEVEFALPTRAGGNGLNANGMINMLCHTATMPMRSLLTYEHRQENAPYKVPYSQSYDPASFMFYGDGKLNTRRYFDTWQQAVVNVRNNTLNFYNEYTSDVKIWQLNREGKRVYGVQLFEAYPTSVSAVDFSYSNQNAITNIAVVLAYKYWLQI